MSIEIDKIEQIQELIELRKSLIKRRLNFEKQSNKIIPMTSYSQNDGHYILQSPTFIMGPFNTENECNQHIVELKNYIDFLNKRNINNISSQIVDVDKQIHSLLR